MKSKQDIQLEAVNSILTGELLLEEAMQKYNVKDKRTMSAWIKKALPILEARKSLSSPRPKGLSEGTEVSQQDHNVLDPYFQAIVKENALLRKVIALQEKVRQLEVENEQLSRKP